MRDFIFFSLSHSRSPLFYHQCLWAFTTSKNLYYEIISKIYHCVFSPHKLQLTFLFFLSRPFSEQKRPHRSGKRLFCSQIIHFSLLLSKTLIISDPRIITHIYLYTCIISYLTRNWIGNSRWTGHLLDKSASKKQVWKLNNLTDLNSNKIRRI